MTETEQLLAAAQPSWLRDNKPVMPSEAFKPSKDWPMSPTLQRKERIMATDVFNDLNGGGGGADGGTGSTGDIDTVMAINRYPRRVIAKATDVGPI